MEVDWALLEGVGWEVKVLRLAGEFRIAHGSTRERSVLRLRRGEAVAEAPFVPYYKDQVELVEEWFQAFEKDGSDRGLIEGGEIPRVIQTALDVLHHELQALRSGLPLWRSLKVPDPNGKSGCRSLGIPEDLMEFQERVRGLSGRFPVLKLKLGSGDLERDEAIVVKAREVNPLGAMLVDVNGGWEVSAAEAMLPRLAKLGIRWVEQPVPHGIGVAGWTALKRVARASGLALYADESVGSVAELRALVECIDGVNVKLLKSRGITGAQELMSEARRLGKGVLLGCMIESSLGVSAAAHLSGLADGIDLDGHFYLAADDFEGLFYDECGLLRLPERPGIGALPRA